MARVKLLEKDQADPIIKEMFQKMEDRKAPIVNIHKAMGNSPKVGRNFVRLGNSILNQDFLDPKLRELAILRVGNLLQSGYEFTKHVGIGKQAGVTGDQIDELSNWASSKKFTDIERAVLQYTDEVTLNVKVSDSTFADLKKFFDDQAIVKLTTTIGYYGMVCRILVALQIELEPGEKALMPLY
ncbi:MAG: carboxymuconolactone decarboxylase family protein [Chloroflexota bacterium]|nr:MAG: carboxymuconolactone decarboxylase family protein [Chloroflexota bacterium]